MGSLSRRQLNRAQKVSREDSEVMGADGRFQFHTIPVCYESSLLRLQSYHTFCVGVAKFRQPTLTLLLGFSRKITDIIIPVVLISTV